MNSSRTRRRTPEKKTVDLSRLRREGERFGVTRFRPGQREIMEAVLSGKDVLGLMPTGSGKSLTFQIPAMLLPESTVVVSPLISLMQDQVEKAEEAEVAAAKVNSTLTASEERETRDAIAEGDHELVYVTPERLENSEYRELLRQGGVSLFVVDEAHCVSQWGHDFRPAYLGIRDAAQELGRPPILALTATATPDVQQDIIQQLGLKDPVIVDTGIERPNLFLEVFRTVNGEAKRQRVSSILNETDGVGIVYVATVRAANELYEWLRDKEINAARYHGKMKLREREEVQQLFMNGTYKVVVATKAFGLGIDKPDIRFIVHFNFPDSPESYYQEIGRAGRDGKPARCPLLYRLEDRRIQGFFLAGKYPRREHSQKVYEVVVGLGDQTNSSGLSAAEVFEACALPQRKVKVILSQLESAGVLQRRAGKIRCIKKLGGADELAAFLSEYEQRHRSDRERIEAMMRYAETVSCRTRFLREYFGEEPGKDCDHCDNCRLKSERESAPVVNEAREYGQVDRAEVPEKPAGPAGHPFQIGDDVRHRRFGPGKVVELSGPNAVVEFADAGQKRIRMDFLKSAA